ncbi:PhoU family transcriptional regulator [Desulfovibrio mangrovi]|uniref:phosphate signaling complex PhoU family protein n=1 Tax=Desulfovibrio mangrovi TaxID=2976983 RepID=UPI002247C1F3|nr:PhoU domain-containing protein [Desulfovibrio mangrovi]UZP67108.1 PhoU family transcriptional regulator [Desulfovibrio mangrovi]
MITFEGLSENFKFIILEVEGQINATLSFLRTPSRTLFDKIETRDDYIDNLKTIIENKCYSRLHTDKHLDKREINRIRAIHAISVNLERIADYCVNIVRQMGYLSDHNFLREADYLPIFEEIQSALQKILPAFEREDLASALAICRAEYELDSMYKRVFERVLTELGSGRDAQSHITVIFIFRYLERIGDSLLNVGEALIFSIIGEKIKITQFEALQRTLTSSGFKGSLQDIDFKAIWGTRSGCRIGRVDAAPEKDGTIREQADKLGSIYKEGTIAKVRKERANIERWSTIFPNLVPQIYGYHEEGTNASLLVEFLRGCTLDEVLLTGEEELVKNAMFILFQTLREVWEKTRRNAPIAIDYMVQLRSRMASIRQVHPELSRESMGVGYAEVLSTFDLLDECEELEEELLAPFSVFIHGDLNVNNVVYDHMQQAIRYVDLHRSRDFDYVQDVSVFMVSNFRMPVFEPAMRKRLNWAIQEFDQFAKTYAAQNNDDTFEARLALALARSFYTSTRYELNFAFAKEMYMRAHFLMDKIVAHKDAPWRNFQLPRDVLYY